MPKTPSHLLFQPTSGNEVYKCIDKTMYLYVLLRTYRELFKVEVPITVCVSDAPHRLLLTNKLNKYVDFKSF